MDYRLTLEDINAAVGEAERYLSERKKNKKEIVRIRLGMEEILLRYREQLGEEREFHLKFGKSLGRTKISVSVQGMMFDPFAQPDEEESSTIMRSALTAMGDLPTWKYFNGKNVIYFNLMRESLPQWTYLILAIAFALVMAFMLQFVSADTRSFIQQDVLAPLSDAFMKVLGSIAGPMIFLSTVWGIYSIGDAATFSLLGRRLAGRYLFGIAAFTLLVTVCCLPFLSLTVGVSEGEGNLFSIILRMLLQILPGNIIEPFSSGNTMQILFLGIVMGIAMILISEKTQTLAIFAEQLNYIVQIVMDFVSQLVPLFVFLSILNIAMDSGLSSLKSVYKLFLFNLMGCAIILLVNTLILFFKVKLRPSLFWKKASPTFFIALTTASSAASFSTNIGTCLDEYGIQKNLTNFGVPFGQVVYKPTAGLLFLTTALYMTECYHVPVSLTWILTAFFMSVLLALATPPIMGGALASFSVLFAQLGIPMEGIAVIAAANALLDFIHTPTNLISGQASLILTAKSSKLLDEDILLNRAKKD